MSLRERTDVVDAVRMTSTFAVAAAVSCVVLHVVLVVLGGTQMAAMSVPMLALSLACASCVRGGPGQGLARRQAVGLAAGGVAMVLLHLVVQHGSGHTGHAGHGGDVGMAMSARMEVAHLVMHAGVTLGAVQAVMAALVVVGTARPSVR